MPWDNVGRVIVLSDGSRPLVFGEVDESALSRCSAGYGSLIRVYRIDWTGTAGRSWPNHVLVRPDGYLAVTGDSGGLETVERFMSLWMGCGVDTGVGRDLSDQVNGIG